MTATKAATKETKQTEFPGETPEQTEARKKEESAAKHREMLKKLASKRVPRVVDAILSVGGLAVHTPTDAQQAAILKPLQDALAYITKELKGEKQKPSFSLPD